MADTIIEKVVGAVASVKDLPSQSVSPSSVLSDLGYDSLDTMNLLFELEETFKVSIPDDEARKVRTVSDIVAGIEKLLAAGAAQGRGDSAA